jgi:hypothetical protein
LGALLFVYNTYTRTKKIHNVKGNPKTSGKSKTAASFEGKFGDGRGPFQLGRFGWRCFFDFSALLVVEDLDLDRRLDLHFLQRVAGLLVAAVTLKPRNFHTRKKASASFSVVWRAQAKTWSSPKKGSNSSLSNTRLTLDKNLSWFARSA